MKNGPNSRPTQESDGQTISHDQEWAAMTAQDAPFARRVIALAQKAEDEGMSAREALLLGVTEGIGHQAMVHSLEEVNGPDEVIAPAA